MICKFLICFSLQLSLISDPLIRIVSWLLLLEANSKLALKLCDTVEIFNIKDDLGFQMLLKFRS